MLGKPVPDFALARTAGTTFRLFAPCGTKLVLYCFQQERRLPFELLANPAEAVRKRFAAMKHKPIECSTKIPGHAQEVLNFVKAL